MPNILVVDDDITIRRLVKRYLEQSGYNVYMADCGDNAIALLQNTDIDFVLLDQIMPGMDGLETFEEMKNVISSPPPVIIGTSLDSTHLAVESMKRGVADFLVKPFDFDILKLKIDRILKATSEKKRKENALKEVHRCSLQNYADPKAMLDAALGVVSDLMGMETAFWGEINEGIVNIKHSINCQSCFAAGNAIPLKDIFYSEVRLPAVPLFIEDAAQSDEWKNHPIYNRAEFASYIGIPILVKEQLYGIISVCSRTARQYDEFSLEITRLFAQKIEREIEKEIMQRELLEAQTLSSISRMTAAIAHEMRQPLTSADMDLAESLELQPGDVQCRKLVSSARSGLKDALLIIRSMMKVYRGKGKKSSVQIDVNRELDDSIALFGYKSKGVEISREFALETSVDTFGNLSSIFVNLIGNALDALEHSGKLKLGTRLENGNVVVTVEDTGSGIQPGVLNKIFEPEFTTKKTGEGTGLGLWIARQEVERIGGEINVESEVDKYTLFSVTIPISNNR